MNDDLLWDGLITKVPEKPNLVSETGLMRLEDIDGEAWRSPSIARNLLDRKFGLGFASRGAGIVQWAWNINPYMPIELDSLDPMEPQNWKLKRLANTLNFLILQKTLLKITNRLK